MYLSQEYEMLKLKNNLAEKNNHTGLKNLVRVRVYSNYFFKFFIRGNQYRKIADLLSSDSFFKCMLFFFLRKVRFMNLS